MKFEKKNIHSNESMVDKGGWKKTYLLHPLQQNEEVIYYMNNYKFFPCFTAVRITFRKHILTFHCITSNMNWIHNGKNSL